MTATAHILNFRRIQSLITWPEIEDRLNDELRWATPKPSIHFVSPDGHKVLDPGYFTHHGVPSKRRIQQLWDAGHSLVLGTVDNLNANLRSFTEDVERSFQRSVFANLYLSSGRNSPRSFNAHTDTTDILICQVQGETDWKVEGKPGRRLLPGDHLYIRKGEWHEARPVYGIPRISVSLGIKDDYELSSVDRYGLRLT